MKLKKYNLSEIDAVDVYKMVLKSEIKKFPDGFWSEENGKKNASDCTKYLIEEILKYSDEDLKKSNLVYMFNRNKLRGMLKVCFNENPYEAINNAYCDKYKPWEFKTTPNGYWENKENGIKATKWLIEEKLKLNEDELKEYLSVKIFEDNGLIGMLQFCFNSSPYEAIECTYPGKFKPWDFKTVPNGFWIDEKNAIGATKWLIEEKLKLSEDELKLRLSTNLFKEHGLSRMLKYYFNGSPYKAINSIYPNKYREWEFKNTPNKYWENKENGIRATRWLVEEKLELSDEDIKETFGSKTFKENGLGSMLQYCFNSSPYEAINSVYPGKFKPWELKSVPYGFWLNKNNGIKAAKWLIEEKLKWDDEQIKRNLSIKLFKTYRLGRMADETFKADIYEIINSVYPGKFKPWELKNISPKFWMYKENSIKATKWLIEDKLSLSDEQIKKELSYDLFKENGLKNMIDDCFEGCVYKAINSVYPGRFKYCELEKML